MTSIPDDPDAVDAAFEAIVSQISTSPAAETRAEELPDEDARADAEVVPPTLGPAQAWHGWDDLRTPSSPDEAPHDEHDEADEGHYVPPEPAPVPRGDAKTRWAWAGAVGAPVLAIVLPLLGWGLDGFTGIGLVVAFLVGFGYLVSRLGGSPDDGAVV